MRFLIYLFLGSLSLILLGCSTAAMNPPELPANDVAPDIALLWPKEHEEPAPRKIIPGQASLGVDNGIIAVVNRKAITLKEFDSAFLRALQNKDWNQKEEELYQLVLDNLIERQLLLEYVDSKKLMDKEKGKDKENEDPTYIIREDDIDAEMEQIVRNYKDGWEGYRRMLEEEKLSIEDIRIQIKENLLLNRVHSEIFRGMGSPSPKEIQQEYKKVESELTIPEKRDVSLITIFMGDYGNNRAKGEDLVKKIKKSLDEGEDFALLAKRFSDGAKAQDGGRQGWVTEDQLANDISKVIFKMDAKEISGPHKTGDLYFFIQCHEIQSAKTKSYAEVQQELSNRISSRQRMARKKEFMDQLFAPSHIEKLSPREYLKYRQSLRPQQ